MLIALTKNESVYLVCNQLTACTSVWWKCTIHSTSSRALCRAVCRTTPGLFNPTGYQTVSCHFRVRALLVQRNKLMIRNELKIKRKQYKKITNWKTNIRKMINNLISSSVRSFSFAFAGLFQTRKLFFITKTVFPEVSVKFKDCCFQLATKLYQILFPNMRTNPTIASRWHYLGVVRQGCFHQIRRGHFPVLQPKLIDQKSLINLIIIITTNSSFRW